jgi:hypothetical protein
MPWITVVMEPPPALAHYSGPVIERVLPLAQARAACGHMGVTADACSWKKGNVCHIVIPTGGPVRDLSAYRRHEVAHCNGWEHSHDAVVVRDGHGHEHGRRRGYSVSTGRSAGDIARESDPLSVNAQ